MPLLVGAALLAGLSCSQDEPADPNASIREIYTLSDLSGLVQPIALHAEQVLDQRAEGFTPEQLEIARAVIRRELDSVKVEQAVLQRLAEEPEHEHLGAALAWLKTPAVGKFMQARASAWNPTGVEEMQIFVDAQQGKPVDERREALIERYEEASRGSDLAAEILSLPAYVVAVLRDALAPEDERRGPQVLWESMIPQRAEIADIFEETSAFVTRFALRDQSNDEVEAFVQFVESPPGRWFYRTAGSALRNGLSEITAHLGDIYGSELPSRREEE